MLLVAQHDQIHHVQEGEVTGNDSHKDAQAKITAYDVVIPDKDTHVRCGVAELVHNSGDGTKRRALTSQTVGQALTCDRQMNACKSAMPELHAVRCCVFLLPSDAELYKFLLCLTHRP